MSKRWSLIVLLWPSILFITLVGGIVVGAYYHTELKVLWWGIMQQQPSAQDKSSEAPSIQDHTPTTRVEASTSIALPNLKEELPLVYSDTLEEEKIQQYLKEGAVVLPLGNGFGTPGNTVVTAHSSGTEAFGPFRFAFAQLSELEPGQEYTIHTPEAAYTYRVYDKEIVWPHQVDRLPNDDRSTVTLVTCWPLWTNFKRLLVHTELISIEYNVET